MPRAHVAGGGPRSCCACAAPTTKEDAIGRGPPGTSKLRDRGRGGEGGERGDAFVRLEEGGVCAAPAWSARCGAATTGGSTPTMAYACRIGAVENVMLYVLV